MKDKADQNQHSYGETGARVWSDDQIELQRSLAQRLWLKIEHALVTHALQDSDHNLHWIAEKLLEIDRPRAEERFFRVFNQSPIMMAILSMDSRVFLEANQAFIDKLECRRDQLIRHTPQELGIWTNQDKFAEALSELADKGKIDNVETQLHTVTGRVLTVLASLDLIDFNHQLCRLIAFQDITAMRLMEFNLARMDRLNLIGEIAASIAHEIRNPLTAVRGFLQMLGSKYEYADEFAYFNLMIDELDRANDIITKFLGMAKDKNIDPKPTYLHEVITALHPLIKADAVQRAMNTRLDLGYTPQVLIDESEIRQLVFNMSYNGLEVMSPGGTLTIGTTLQDNEVVLFIKDEGPGISAPLLDRLGTPFLTTKDDGPGLGLAVCYSIAARHNARIEVETSSQGTVFYVCFSIAETQTRLF